MDSCREQYPDQIALMARSCLFVDPLQMCPGRVVTDAEVLGCVRQRFALYKKCRYAGLGVRELINPREGSRNFLRFPFGICHKDNNGWSFNSKYKGLPSHGRYQQDK